MNYLLDSNVISALRVRGKNPRIEAWASVAPLSTLFTSAISIAEIERGICAKERTDPTQGRTLRLWLENNVLPSFANRTLPFDLGAARILSSYRVPEHAPYDDALIASISQANGLTVVDRITPAATAADVEEVSLTLPALDHWAVVAEPFTQWVLEDNFPYGRPAFEDVGATFVSNVAEFEALKLRLLNGAHQAVAYQGQLSGYVHVHEALADPKIYTFLKNFMARDVLPTLTVPTGFDAEQYIETLLDRFSNSHIGDRLARLSQDSSSRMPKFVLPTIMDSLAHGTSYEFGTRVLADWLRYLILGATTDRFTLDDPQLTQLRNAAISASADPVEFLNNLPQLRGLLEYPAFLEEFRRAFADS